LGELSLVRLVSRLGKHSTEAFGDVDLSGCGCHEDPRHQVDELGDPLADLASWHIQVVEDRPDDRIGLVNHHDHDQTSLVQ
jgi:hypothetical protein